VYPSPRCSQQQDSGRSITFRLPPKPAYRSILFASRAWTIPVGAAALLTAWRPARPRLPVPTPNAWPIPGTDPAPTLHNLLLREQRAWVGHFRLGRRRDDENIQPVIAMTGLTYESPTSSRWLLFRFCSPPRASVCRMPMHASGVGAATFSASANTCSPCGIMGISSVRRAEIA